MLLFTVCHCKHEGMDHRTDYVTFTPSPPCQSISPGCVEIPVCIHYRLCQITPIGLQWYCSLLSVIQNILIFQPGYQPRQEWVILSKAQNVSICVDMLHSLVPASTVAFCLHCESKKTVPLLFLL